MSQFKRTGGSDFPSHLKVLLTGDPKSGKTSFLGTVPNIVILDSEPHANNMMSIAHLNIPVATISSRLDLDQIRLQLGDPTLRQALASSLGMTSIDAVAIDTLDTLQGILKTERMKEQRQTKMLRDDWGWLKEEMTAIISAFTALPMHVFFTVHTKTITIGSEERGDQRTVVSPGLDGAISEKIAGMVGYSLYNFRRQDIKPDGTSKTSYYLRAEGDETYAFLGNRAAGRLPEIIEPNFRTLHHFAELARKEAAEQAAVSDQAVARELLNATPAQPQAPAPVAAPVAAPAQTSGQTSGQQVQAAQQPAAPAQLPADEELVNAAALSHIKKVYDALGLSFPEEHVKTKTLGEARTVVKMWKAIQEDAAQGKVTEGSTPQDDMLNFLTGMNWIPEGLAAAEAEVTVDPKVDGTIEQVKAYVGDDLAKAQEAFNLESSRDKPRAGLISWLTNKGAREIQTPVQEQPAEVTPEPAQAEVTPVAAQADASTTEAPAEAPAEGKCEACGNAVDDLDIATLAQTRFGQRLCVNDYILRTKA